MARAIDWFYVAKSIDQYIEQKKISKQDPGG
jgi:hypothetical protein